MENNQEARPQQQKEDINKTIAIVSYMTIVGWVISLVLMSNDDKNKIELNKYHLRDSLGINIAFASVMFITMPLAFIPYLGWFLSFTLYIGISVFWILGVINAANGVIKPLPIIDNFFQKIFSSLVK